TRCPHPPPPPAVATPSASPSPATTRPQDSARRKGQAVSDLQPSVACGAQEVPSTQPGACARADAPPTMADRAHSTAWAAGVRSAAAYRGAMGPGLAGRGDAGQLTDTDLRLLASVAGGGAGTGPPAD